MKRVSLASIYLRNLGFSLLCYRRPMLSLLRDLLREILLLDPSSFPFVWDSFLWASLFRLDVRFCVLKVFFFFCLFLFNLQNTAENLLERFFDACTKDICFSSGLCIFLFCWHSLSLNIIGNQVAFLWEVLVVRYSIVIAKWEIVQLFDFCI